jgi:hypothetical protein
MKVIESLILVLQGIKNDYRELALEVIAENAVAVADLNRAQLNAGIRPDGSEIDPPYAPRTIVIKARKGQPFDRVTQKDTGDFHASIGVNIFPDSFELVGTDPKTTKLRTKYGETTGLTEESKAILVNDILAPGLLAKIQNRLPQ